MMKEFARWIHMQKHFDGLRLDFFTSSLLNNLSVRNYTGATIDAVLVLVNLFPLKGTS